MRAALPLQRQALITVHKAICRLDKVLEIRLYSLHCSNKVLPGGRFIKFIKLKVTSTYLAISFSTSYFRSTSGGTLFAAMSSKCS